MKVGSVFGGHRIAVDGTCDRPGRPDPEAVLPQHIRQVVVDFDASHQRADAGNSLPAVHLIHGVYTAAGLGDDRPSRAQGPVCSCSGNCEEVLLCQGGMVISVDEVPVERNGRLFRGGHR